MRYPALLSVLIAFPCARADSQVAGDTSQLAPVVITASRTDAPQAVATTAATVLRGDALRARGITTIGAALREVPGVALVQTSAPGSQTSLFLRGGEPDYVQVLIDGITINEPGGTINFANLTLDNVDRIEIVRGPASVLYGSDAVTGVIQIFTRQGGDSPRAELGVRGGQRGMLDIDGTVAGGGPRARYSVGGGHHESSGLYDLNNDLRNTDVSGRLVVAPTSRSSVALTTRYVDARYDYPTEYYGAPLDRDSYSTERRLAAGVDAMYAVHPRVDGRVVLGLSRLQNVSDDRADGPGDFPFRYDARSLRRSADARVELRLIERSTLTLGGDFDWQETETNSDAPQSLPLLERWSRAGYAQLIGNVAGRITYSLGGRLEQNERFGSLGNLRGGLGVLITPSTTLRASGGSAFKEPQFPEITGGCCAIANRSLGPERSTGWDVGFEQRLVGDAVAIGATYFDQRFRDLIVYAPADGSTTEFQYQNAQAATSRGWEVEARAGSAGGASVRANLTGLDAVVRATPTTAERPLPRRPSHTGALVVASPVGRRLTLVGDATYVGKRHDVRFFPDAPFQQAERLPAYTLVGIAATLHAGRIAGATALEMTARVDNLFDEDYEAVAGFETPGRVASVGVRFRFGR